MSALRPAGGGLRPVALAGLCALSAVLLPLAPQGAAAQAAADDQSGAKAAPVANAPAPAANAPATAAPKKTPAAEKEPQAQSANTASEAQRAEYAYCGALFATLRENDPGMVSGISANVDATLTNRAREGLSWWQQNVTLKGYERQGAGDARDLLGKAGLLGQGASAQDRVEAGSGLARCWTTIQPFLKPAAKSGKPAAAPKP